MIMSTKRDTRYAAKRRAEARKRNREIIRYAGVYFFVAMLVIGTISTVFIAQVGLPTTTVATPVPTADNALRQLVTTADGHVATGAYDQAIPLYNAYLAQLAVITRGGNPDAEHRPLPHGLCDELDLNHVGMFGHSDGGATTAAAMPADPRITAGIDLDGTLWTTEARAGTIENRTDPAELRELVRQVREALGDILLWDNRSLIHSVNVDYSVGERRLHQRILLKGERPV